MIYVYHFAFEFRWDDGKTVQGCGLHTVSRPIIDNDSFLALVDRAETSVGAARLDGRRFVITSLSLLHKINDKGEVL